MVDLERVRDIELLRQVAKIQDAELRRVHTKLKETIRIVGLQSGKTPAQIEAELQKADDDYAESTRRMYGGGSERRPRKRDKPDKPKAEQKGHGPKPQPDLIVEEHVHVLDAADETFPDCGGHLEAFEGQFEESEEIDVVEIQYVLKKHKRQKYRCGCGHIETALGPDKIVPGGRFSTGFGVHVALNKFGDHLPLERQARRMKRVGLDVDSQTLWDQTFGLATRLQPTIDRLHAYLLSKEVVLADETRWPLLGMMGRKTKNWFVWSLAADDAVLYKIQDGRSNEEGRELLRDFKGVAVTDGYIVYDSLSKTNGFVLANCWSHARRKFIEAEASEPGEAADFIDKIGALFGIERETDVRCEELSPIDAKALRLQVRDEQSRPIVRDIGEAAAKVKAFKGSPIAKALQYLENRWDHLTVFLEDPRVPLTSNAVERSLRGPVLGRNNHFGSRSKRGTEVAALFYSLIESAKLNSINPSQCERPVDRREIGRPGKGPGRMMASDELEEARWFAKSATMV
jgi:transposase